MRTRVAALLGNLCGLGLASAGQPALAAELLLSGNDQKVTWDDAGKVVNGTPGGDTVSVIDIGTDPANPRIVADLPLTNSVFGPPTNLAITPDGSLGLVANSMRWVQGGQVWKAQPDNKVHVIDLTASPPVAVATVVVGDGPEGFAISPKGDLAVAVLLKGSGAVAKDAWFRNDAGSVVALRIDGKKVTPGEEVAVGRLPEGAVFSRDGGHLYVGNSIDGDVSILKVDGGKVTNTGQKLKLPGRPAAMRGSQP